MADAGAATFMVVARAGAKARAGLETVRARLPAERRHTARLLAGGQVRDVEVDVVGGTAFLVFAATDYFD